MEQVFCIARTDLEKLSQKPLPRGAFSIPGLEAVLSLPQHYIPRDVAEINPDYKQIIPYQIFRSGYKIFVYQRGSSGGEQRLQGKYSVGIGGHINKDDTAATTATLCLESYNNALQRERHEELLCKPNGNTMFLGWINDDSDAVGQVHLGAVHCCTVKNKDDLVIRHGGEDISAVGWMDSKEILQMEHRFETWSLLALSLV